MTALKSLNFVALPKIAPADPIVVRRNAMVTKLTEQRELLKNPAYTRTVKTVVEKDGIKTKVEKAQKIRPWFRQNAHGSVAFFMMVGFKPLEFSRGKHAVSCASMNDLPKVIDVLVQATRAGELDAQLVPAPTKKK